LYLSSVFVRSKKTVSRIKRPPANGSSFSERFTLTSYGTDHIQRQKPEPGNIESQANFSEPDRLVLDETNWVHAMLHE
jgi:hypothetical protein